jgi:type III secretion system FlhB-like substrate exporter
MPSYRGTYLFSETIYAMAQHPGTLQQRLADAMQQLSSVDMPGSMPESLVGQVAELFAWTTKVDPRAMDIAPEGMREDGSFNATCLTMSNDEAARAVGRIVHLAQCMDELRADVAEDE